MSKAVPLFAVREDINVMVGSELKPARVVQITKTGGTNKYKILLTTVKTKKIIWVAVGDEEGKMFPECPIVPKEEIKEEPEDEEEPAPSRRPPSSSQRRGKSSDVKLEIIEPAPAPAKVPVSRPKPAIKVELPQNLMILVNECQEMCRLEFFMILPVMFPVNKIVEHCVDAFNRDRNLADKEMKINVANATIRLFDAVVGHHLLSKWERTQFNNLTPKGALQETISYSKFYGIAHYLRMMIRMPDFVRLMDPQGTSADYIANALVDIIAFLSKNAKKYYKKDATWRTATLDEGRSVRV